MKSFYPNKNGRRVKDSLSAWTHLHNKVLKKRGKPANNGKKFESLPRFEQYTIIFVVRIGIV